MLTCCPVGKLYVGKHYWGCVRLGRVCIYFCTSFTCDNVLQANTRNKVGKRLYHLSPKQLPKAHKQAPQPLLHVERRAAKRLSPKLHDHNLNRTEQHGEQAYCKHIGLK